ncbi:class I SAM-dependent methyltransferase [Amylibacter sp.]|jgi:2-polyprenyl-3-methyl-5-hydroxy-6-metoxy-1,4-benzoquinol methylase|nr:class I SAM-dependent methyltransferase [Amylibacter sp.]
MKNTNSSENYEPSIVERYGKEYFKNRYGNDDMRLRQFQIDEKFLKKFKSKGIICDVGCSTGEFLKSIAWRGELYGMEINLEAKAEAQQNGFSFEKNIFTETNFFDVVLFRGTIQHVDEPFRMMKAAYKSLKKGGIIIFFVTPNTDSILYRLKGDLPFLDSKLNFFIPGKKNLSNTLENFGFELLATEFPYWDTPYRNFPKDIFLFLLNIFTNRFHRHAFWGSSMSLVAKK